MHMNLGGEKFSVVLYNALEAGNLYAGITDVDGGNISKDEAYYWEMYGYDPAYADLDLAENNYVTCTGCKYFLKGECFSLRTWIVNSLNENKDQTNKIERCSLYEKEE